MIRVTEAISDTNIGGAGILLLNRLKHTDAKKFKTTVILPKGSILLEKLKKIGVKTIEINGCRDRSFDLLAIFEYFSLLKKLRPDVINSHGSLSFRIAARMVGVPVKLYTRHCVYPIENNNAFLRMLRGALSNVLSDRIIAVAYAAKENLICLGIDKNKISVIINGAEKIRVLSEKEKRELREAYGISPEQKTVTIFARLEECKDHICFLRAAKLLSEHSDKYRFFIVGGGSLENKLIEYAKKSGLESKVIFTGYVDDVAPFFNITDVNVNCSIGTETSSLALSEGMSIGVPSVVSDYGGNPYMVRCGVNGYLYKAGDFKDLAKKIRKIATSDKEEYARLCFESKKRFEQELNAEKMSRSTQDLYMKLYKEKMKPKR